MDRVLQGGWSAFVAAFLYYVVLTAMVISGQDLSRAFIVASYALPPFVAAVLLVVAGTRAVLAGRLVPHRALSAAP